MKSATVVTNKLGTTDNTWYLDCIFLLILLGILFFTLLGSRPLFVPDEGRYAEIAREMVVSGDYITPYLNGIKYFEKPIFFYWLSALAIKMTGLNLWSLRSINGILAILGCLLTYLTARTFYGRRVGLLSAGILATSMLYFVMAHMISLDICVSFFLMSSLYLVLLGNETPQHRSTYFYLAAASAACAVLTKGLIGIVFPAMIIGIWIMWLGKWNLLKQYGPKSVILFLLIVIPWHVLVEIRNPGASYFYFVEQHFLRYATTEVGHYQPVWFFIPILLLGFFPWIVFLPQTLVMVISNLWRSRQHYQTELFLFLWASTIFLFFSFSKSKLIPYILPVFPPLAILTARYLADITAQFRLTRRLVTVLFVLQCLFLLLLVFGAPGMDTRTILPLATIVKKQMTPADDVITYNQYFQDLPFYLQRRVSILNWRNELRYGLSQQKNVDWLIDDVQFWQRWHSGQRLFVIISLDEYNKLKNFFGEERLFLLGKTLTTALISNQKARSTAQATQIND